MNYQEYVLFMISGFSVIYGWKFIECDCQNTHQASKLFDMSVNLNNPDARIVDNY